jgi:hypothetical protein
MIRSAVLGQGPLGQGQPDPDSLQVLPQVEPLMRFHLCYPARLERFDKVGHTLPQVGHLLESADHCHRHSIIELMFEEQVDVKPREQILGSWYRLRG